MTQAAVRLVKRIAADRLADELGKRLAEHVGGLPTREGFSITHDVERERTWLNWMRKF